MPLSGLVSVDQVLGGGAAGKGRPAASAGQADGAGLAELLRVLADGTRLRLLFALSNGERHVSDLLGDLRLPQPTVSHHLGILRMAGVVEARRDGKRVYYRLIQPPPAPGVLRFTAGASTVELAIR